MHHQALSWTLNNPVYTTTNIHLVFENNSQFENESSFKETDCYQKSVWDDGNEGLNMQLSV